MAIGGKPDAVHPEEGTQLAMKLAAKFVKSRQAIDDYDFAALKTCFDEKQISELCAFLVFVSASHQLGVLMDVGPEDSP